MTNNLENQKTLAYYENNTDYFIERTWLQLVVQDLERFIAYLPEGGKVLDAGCGSGRDSLYFSQQGFEVTAFDGSLMMSKKASLKTGLSILHLDFLNMNWINQFDGVWAMSSLLHFPDHQLLLALNKCLEALNEQGVMYASFKEGVGSYEDENGRFFNLINHNKLVSWLEKFKKENKIADYQIVFHKSFNNNNTQNWISFWAFKDKIKFNKK